MVVVGRTHECGPTGLLGRYRARDGTHGAALEVDLDHPHAGLVVGKRGSGKSYTLAVLAEALARADGVVPVVVDPMGTFGTLAWAPVCARIASPTVRPDRLSPRTWCDLLGLDPESGAGSLVWRAARERATIREMRTAVADADAPTATRRAASNHLELAASWDVFDPAGLGGQDLVAGPRVLDCSGLADAPANAVVAAVAASLYAARRAGEVDPMPWLLVDEAHVFTDGVAAAGLRQILTRGRQPGVSLVLATQRPGALPGVAHSQSDLLVAHRVTDAEDRDALAASRPTYMDGSFAGRMPTETGEALVVDDATESVHAIQIRERETPDGGTTPRASGGDA